MHNETMHNETMHNEKMLNGTKCDVLWKPDNNYYTHETMCIITDHITFQKQDILIALDKSV